MSPPTSQAARYASGVHAVTDYAARLSRKLTEKEIAYLAESAAHYVALKNEYLATTTAKSE